MALTFEQYINSYITNSIILVEINNNGDMYYLSDKPYRTDPVDTHQSIYNAIISPNGIPRLKSKMSDVLTGRAIKNYSILRLLTSVLFDGSDLSVIYIQGATVTVKIAAPRNTFPYANAVTLFIGKIGHSSSTNGRDIEYIIEDLQADFENIKLPINQYDLTNEGANFPLVNDKKNKPICIGDPAHVTPVLIDENTFTYQFHDVNINAPVDNVQRPTCYDDGLRLLQDGIVQIGNYTSIVFDTSIFSNVPGYYNNCFILLPGGSRKIVYYNGTTAFLDSALSISAANGQTFSLDLFEIDFIKGNVRLLEKPIGQVTVSPLVGPLDPITFKAEVPKILSHLCTEYAGLPLNNIDISLNNGIGMGIFLEDEISLSSLITQICTDRFAWWSFTRNGVFKVRTFGVFNSSIKTITKGEEKNISWKTFKKIFWRYKMLGIRQWTKINNLSPLLNVSLRESLQQKYSDYKVIEDANIKNNYSNASEYLSKTLFSSTWAGILTYAMTIFGVPRKVVIIEIPFALPLIQLGDTITLNGFNTALNQDFIVIGFTDKIGGSAPTQVLELWG